MQASSVDEEDVSLCRDVLGHASNLCDRIQSVANTPDSTLDAATTVAITAGAIVPIVLMLPGDPSQYTFWQQVFVLGGPTIAQISGVVTVLLSGGWHLVMLHLTADRFESLSSVSTQLADTAKWAYWLGFIPVIVGFAFLVIMEGVWNVLSVACKISPPSDDFDGKVVDKALVDRIQSRSNYVTNLLSNLQSVSRAAVSNRRLHSLPAFDHPAARHLEVLICAHLSKLVVQVLSQSLIIVVPLCGRSDALHLVFHTHRKTCCECFLHSFVVAFASGLHTAHITLRRLRRAICLVYKRQNTPKRSKSRLET